MSSHYRRPNSRYSKHPSNHHNSRPVNRYSNSQAQHENTTTRRLMVHQTSPEFAASILASKRFSPSQRWDQIYSIYFAETVPKTKHNIKELI